jgi:hypothetical protein
VEKEGSGKLGKKTPFKIVMWIFEVKRMKHS